MFGQFGAPFGLPTALADYQEVLAEIVAFLVGATIVYFVGRILLSPLILRVVRARNHNNPTIETAVETYLKVAFALLAIFTGIIAAGHGDVLTGSAVIIAALTFLLGISGQEVFGSLISGMFLVADPDFNVGDWISWSGGAGTIEAVDFRVTRIRTANNETITVPNTELTTNSLTRPFGRATFRVTERAFVPYNEDTEQALLALQQVAANQPQALSDPAPNSRITDLGANAITLQAEFWVDDPARSNVATIRSDFRRELKRRFEEAGLTLAPPSGQELSGSIRVEREAVEN
ncbi:MULTISPECIES: mechanosensitive ion channel family protein [unclassified Haladaptatus]|uniref:mechanosensitive ion channel family protein n=1 Tax=unclassified Haladaptatus TaxID=2622732 RepID=UPI0023E82794|nr:MULTISPECIES: mechanosensitive ion channel domain-containing protein [unclassified Haladaptatus]